MARRDDLNAAEVEDPCRKQRGSLSVFRCNPYRGRVIYVLDCHLYEVADAVLEAPKSMQALFTELFNWRVYPLMNQRFTVFNWQPPQFPFGFRAVK